MIAIVTFLIAFHLYLQSHVYFSPQVVTTVSNALAPYVGDMQWVIAVYFVLIICVVFLLAKLALSQYPPADLQLAYSKEIVAAAYFRRINALCWRHLGGTVLIVAALNLILDLVDEVAIHIWSSTRIGLLSQVPSNIFHINTHVVYAALMLVFLFYQRYALLNAPRSQLRFLVLILPAVACHLVYGLLWQVNSSIYLFYLLGKVQAAELVGPTILVCALAIIASWFLNRQTYAAAQRLFAEES